jgi:hypothetical protein
MRKICTPSLLAVIFFALPFSAPASKSRSDAISATTSFIFEGNRIYAELAFVRPDGTLHKTLAFVDSGSPSMIVSPALFDELQLSQGRAVTFQIGGLPIHLNSSATTKDPWLPFAVGENRQVEALLPAGVMQGFQVVIDYAEHSLTFRQPGGIKNEGTAVPFRINEKTGLMTVDATIDGHSYPMTIDCGSAYSWLRKTTAKSWLPTHPEWERGTGAVGASNMRMADDGIEAEGTLLRIPEMRLASLPLQQVGALAIGPSKTNWDFMDWYSEKNPVLVIGWLGGNVLHNFRITLDYPNRTSYWLQQTQPDAHDLDQVGLTLKFTNGKYLVSAVVSQKAKPTVEGVQPGDELLQIDALQTKGTTWGAIFSALHGRPGEDRSLLVKRGDRQFIAHAPVIAF